MHRGWILVLLALPLVAGCTALNGGGSVSINGVSPASDGKLNLTAGPGLIVTPSAENHTLGLGLAQVVQAPVLQACGAAGCRNLTVNPGTLIADADIVGLANLSLVASDASRDPAINFYGPNLAGLHVLRWSQAQSSFQADGDLLAVGNLTATRYLSTRTLLVTANGVPFTISTAPTEGTEVTIFARGSAQLANGSATVALPAPFVALADPNGTLTAQVTLTSEGPALYVAEKARDHITVRATTGAPSSSATFDWFVQAPRKGTDGFVV